MPDIQKQYILLNLLKNNKLTSTELNAVLGQPGYSVEFANLISKRNYAIDIATNAEFFDVIVNSSVAMTQAAQSERFVRAIMTNGQSARKSMASSFFHSNLTNATKDVLKEIVGDNRYKLRRSIILSAQHHHLQKLFCQLLFFVLAAAGALALMMVLAQTLDQVVAAVNSEL